jgi:hypothetical protein
VRKRKRKREREREKQRKKRIPRQDLLEPEDSKASVIAATVAEGRERRKRGEIGWKVDLNSNLQS